MKKILSLLCMLSAIALFTSCDNGDSGGSIGGSVADVSWDLYEQSDWVTCYNADRSVVTNPYQTCEWNCGTLDGSLPHYYKVTFFYDEATGDYAIDGIKKGQCRL